jgi:hypothetical protein
MHRSWLSDRGFEISLGGGEAVVDLPRLDELGIAGKSSQGGQWN